MAIQKKVKKYQNLDLDTGKQFEGLNTLRKRKKLKNECII